jgi:hypothetical protein
MNKTKVPEIPLYDLYDLWYEPVWHKAWFWWCVGGLLFALGMIGIILFIRMYKARKHTLAKTPSQILVERLNALNIEAFKKPEKHKLFYSELTDILKCYLIQHYGMSLESKTDDEVIMLIKTSLVPQELHENLASIFYGALYIKFAHKDAAYQQMHDDLQRSMEIVIAPQ